MLFGEEFGKLEQEIQGLLLMQTDITERMKQISERIEEMSRYL